MESQLCNPKHLLLISTARKYNILLYNISVYPASVESSHDEKNRTDETSADNQDLTYFDAHRRFSILICWRFKEHRPVILESTTTDKSSSNLLLHPAKEFNQ